MIQSVNGLEPGFREMDIYWKVDINFIISRLAFSEQ